MDQFSPAYFHQMSNAKFKLLRGTPGKESFKDVGPLNVNQHPWLPIGINASRLGTHTKKKKLKKMHFTQMHLGATCQCAGSFLCSFLFSVLEEAMDNSWLSMKFSWIYITVCAPPWQSFPFLLSSSSMFW